MILSLILSLLILAGTTTVFLRALKMVYARRSWTALVVFGLALFVAGFIGIRFGVYGDFQINEQVRMQGAPVPLTVFVLEEQRWTDYVKPPFVGGICTVANAVFPIGLLCVLWVVVLMFLGRSPTAR